MKHLYYNDRMQFISSLEKLAENFAMDRVVDDIIFIEKVQMGISVSRDKRTICQRINQ